MDELQSTHNRSLRVIIWIGLILLAAPYVTLFLMFGNREVTGVAATIWPLYFLSSISGMILIVVGLIKRAKKAPLTANRRKYGYIMLAVAGLCLLPPVIAAVTTSAHTSFQMGVATLFVNLLINLMNPLFLLFLFGGIYFVNQKSLAQANERTRPYMWVFLLTLAGWFFSNALRNWSDRSFDQFASPWMSFGMIALIFIVLLITKLVKKLTWANTLNNLGGVLPRDERELAALEKASRMTVVVAVLTAIVGAAVSLSAPAPSANSLYTALVAYALFLLGIRNFFAWRMGLR